MRNNSPNTSVAHRNNVITLHQVLVETQVEARSTLHQVKV